MEQAYLRYNWPGRVARGDGSTETIATFEETARAFDHWRRTMAAIMARGVSKPDDHELFILTAQRIRFVLEFPDPEEFRYTNHSPPRKRGDRAQREAQTRPTASAGEPCCRQPAMMPADPQVRSRCRPPERRIHKLEPALRCGTITPAGRLALVASWMTPSCRVGDAHPGNPAFSISKFMSEP